MSKSKRETPDFDDLLFEKRNKDYGAYQLRKKYNSSVITGIILASLLVSSAVVFPFVLTPHSEHVFSGGVRYVQVKMENLEPPKETMFVPPPPAPPEDSRLQEVVKYVPPVVVDTIPSFMTTQATVDEILAQSTTNDQVGIVGGNGTGDDLLSGQEGIVTDEPFFVVEVMPSFKGGDINKFREWVQVRCNYPQAAIDRKIQGRVFLTFIIEQDGNVSNVTVVKGVDPLIDNEAVKTIQASPRWKPGLQRGQPVRVRFSMWLNFRP
ncbi:MAG: energy transducer TonB [Bacteroidales bacterium]|nr:energy transducer TonB [Bacteroidales bacterium]